MIAPSATHHFAQAAVAGLLAIAAALPVHGENHQPVSPPEMWSPGFDGRA